MNITGLARVAAICSSVLCATGCSYPRPPPGMAHIVFLQAWAGARSMDNMTAIDGVPKTDQSMQFDVPVGIHTFTMEGDYYDCSEGCQHVPGGLLVKLRHHKQIVTIDAKEYKVYKILVDSPDPNGEFAVEEEQ